MEIQHHQTSTSSHELLKRFSPDNYQKLFYDHYSELVPLCCPDYDEMLDAIVSGIPKGAETVVDLGCGVGTLLGKIASRLPQIKKLVGADLNSVFLEKAREAIPEKWGGSLTLTQKDYFEPPLPHGDVYVSSLSIHNAPTVEQLIFYIRLFRSAPSFIHFEEIKGENREQEEERWDFIRWWFTEIGIADPVRDAVIENMQKTDCAFKISHHEELATRAGRQFSLLKTNPAFAVYRTNLV